MKKWLTLVTALIVTFSLAACGNETPLPDTDADAPAVKTGDIAAQKGKWTYFINGMADSTARNFGWGEAELGALVRMSADRFEKDVVVPQIVLSFTIDGEWIYYVSPKLNGGDQIGAVYSRVRIDGTQHRRIADISDYIYFEIDEDVLVFCRDGKLYASAHDMSGKKLLAEETVYEVFRNGDDVIFTAAEYYAAADDYYPCGVYVTDVNGAPVRTLTSRSCYLLGVIGGDIVLMDYNTGKTETMDMSDGTSDTRVHIAFDDATCADGLILFNNYMDNTGLYVYDTASRELKLLFGGKAMFPRLYNNRVYFYNVDDEYRLYTVAADGSDEAAKLCKHRCATEMEPEFLNGYLYYINADDEDYAYRIDLETGYYQYIAYIGQ